MTCSITLSKREPALRPSVTYVIDYNCITDVIIYSLRVKGEHQIIMRIISSNIQQLSGSKLSRKRQGDMDNWVY